MVEVILGSEGRAWAQASLALRPADPTHRFPLLVELIGSSGEVSQYPRGQAAPWPSVGC